MLRLVMEQAGLAFWPTLSLLIFFGVLLGVLLWIFRPGSSDFYRRLGGMVLQDNHQDKNPGAAASAASPGNAPLTPKTSAEN